MRKKKGTTKKGKSNTNNKDVTERETTMRDKQTFANIICGHQIENTTKKGKKKE